MPRKKVDVLDNIDYTLFLVLKLIDTEEDKSYSNILKKSKLSPTGFYKKIKTLLELNLISISYVKNKTVLRPKTTYKLTDKGKKVLKLLEELRAILKTP